MGTFKGDDEMITFKRMEGFFRVSNEDEHIGSIAKGDEGYCVFIPKGNQPPEITCKELIEIANYLSQLNMDGEIEQ